MLGLTPVERLDALSRYHSDPTSHRLFVIIGLTIIGILTILLLLSVYRRKKSIQPVAGVFDEYADARNLSDHEYRILMNMAVGAKLKRTEFIFTLPSVFDRQSALMIEDTQAAHGIEESLKLQTQLDLLREKLNFRHYTSPDELMVTDAETQSTRQIPLKKKLFIKRNHRTSNGDLEAVVLENTTEGLMVQFKRPVEIVFGQPWVCRCYTGGLVAEFNTTVLRCSVQQAVLAHSDHVRLINRRRFLRVPMQQPAYIAKFPFKKETPEDDLNGSTPVRRQTLPAENPFEPPQFVPATVIELGGPGLRIRTTLKLTVGERILLMFKLDQHQKTAASSEEAGKIIEHIAVVRHLIDDQNDAVAALELVGLNDDGIDELIRVTNEASIKLNKWRNSYQQTQNTDPQTLPV
jgi:hypothetical protein